MFRWRCDGGSDTGWPPERGGLMFGDRFSHYLSYGATDQKTVTALAGEFDGLVVPGTVAAFQLEGTGGFVLTLSAAASLQYAIDPRFPLFQQRLLSPKKSHIALAELLGVPTLIRTIRPSADDFTPDIVRTIAQNWATFNSAYHAVAGGKFDKYAKRLGEQIRPRDARPPDFVLPPYLVSDRPGDAWWTVSRQLFDETAAALGSVERCVRVIATDRSVGLLQGLDVGESSLVLWLSGLNELSAESVDLAEYGSAIRSLSRAGKKTFAIYGGFFSVLLQNLGLGGSSHGIGFGESREWIELPESGPPPARYYVPQLHRYLQPDEATRLVIADRRLAECRCQECRGDPPSTLDYHALMRHSVRCRAQEIRGWQGLGVEEMGDRLGREMTEWIAILEATRLPEVVLDRSLSRAAHLRRWLGALRILARED